MIINIQQARELGEKLRQEGKTTGLSQGNFDVLHAGHIEHFRLCKEHCDVLFVAVMPDRFAAKGPDRPIYSQAERAEIVNFLSIVDYVVCEEWDDETALFMLDVIRPSYYIKGTEYRDTYDLTRNIDKEIAAVRSHGGEILYLSGHISSSTKLIGEIIGKSEICKYAEPATHYLEILDKISKLKVGIIGEGILDEYVPVDSLGSANKYPILSVQEAGKHRIDQGGVLAMRNFISGLCKDTYLIGPSGSQCPYIDGSIVKTRYVDREKHNKLFEVNNKFNIKVNSEKLRSFLANNQLDLLLISDFGHGGFPEEIVKVIEDFDATSSCYLMAQHNSANRYMNFPWKFNNVCKETLCLNKKEVIINSGQSDIKKAAEILLHTTGCKRIFVTRGKDGSSCYDGIHEYYVPAVSTTIKDTIGCGDVFFSISSLVMQVINNPKDALVMGNIFAYLHAQIDGNSDVVKKNDFIRLARGLK